MKHLRGTRLDPFGYTAERRLERKMITDYEALLAEIADRLSPATHAAAVKLAALALDVKGFGHVKHKNYEHMQVQQENLLRQLRNPTPAPALKAAE
jgi:indolepyruvate ferredoxin oxidoreductase